MHVKERDGEPDYGVMLAFLFLDLKRFAQ